MSTLFARTRHHIALSVLYSLPCALFVTILDAGTRLIQKQSLTPSLVLFMFFVYGFALALVAIPVSPFSSHLRKVFNSAHTARYIVMLLSFAFIGAPLLFVLFLWFLRITDAHLRSVFDMIGTFLVVSGSTLVASLFVAFLDRIRAFESVRLVTTLVIGACILSVLLFSGLYVYLAFEWQAAGWVPVFLLLVVLYPLMSLLTGNMRLPSFLSWVLIFSFLAFFALAHVTATFSPAATKGLTAKETPSSRLVKVVWHIIDFDRDGFAYVWGGGDCDDLDSSINPAQIDVPNNGIDEDCDGEDAVVPEERANKSTQRVYFARKDDVRRYNVVFVCIDAMRADHVSLLGYNRKTTPTLERLATSSWVFENAISPSATTRETVPSLMTGLYPSRIEWVKNDEIWQIPETTPQLSDILKKAGYKTIAIVDEWLDRFLPSFKKGFDHFEVPYGTGKWLQFGQQAAPFIAFSAIKQIEQMPKSALFFMYLQFEAPHHPYVNHPEVPTFGQKDIDRYDAEIAYADYYLGVLVNYLQFKGLLDRTILVVFADHGEEFGEHGQFQHSRQIYVESVHVPLLIRIPGEKALRVKDRVSLVDVFPTVLDALGLKNEGLSPDGVSLFYLLSPEARSIAGERYIFSELRVIAEGGEKFLKAVYYGPHKLIWEVETGKRWLFDVNEDPQEKSPISSEETEQALMRSLKEHVQGSYHMP